MSVTLTAPTTGEKIEVLSTTDVVNEIKVRVPWPKFHENYLKKLTDKGQFPAPWLEIGGRKGWLRQDLDQWIAQKSEGHRERAREEAAQRYAGLSGKELDRELAELKKRIQAGQ